MKQVLITTLLAALGLAALSAVAPATPAPSLSASLAEEWEFEEEFEDGEGLELEEECLDSEELEALCEEETLAAAPCPLRSVSGHAVRHDKRLKITLGYTAHEPTAAKIQIHRLGTFRRHLSRSGVLRFTTTKRTRRVVISIRTPERTECPPLRLVVLPR